MDLLVMGLRTVLVYFLVFIVLRIMGKREIGKLSIFDLVISIMVAEIAVLILEDIQRPIIEGVLPMFILVLIQVALAHISLKNRKLRLWIDGRPSVIISNGKLNREEMKKQKYNLDDLFTQLRDKNITNVADVEFAFLETTGRLTVVEKEEKKEQGSSTNLTSHEQEAGRDPQSQTGIRYEGLPIPLIMDGKVQDHNLDVIHQNRFWLKNQLQAKGITDFKDVFICTYDHKGRIYVDKK